jgi:hypothetical protein
MSSFTKSTKSPSKASAPISQKTSPPDRRGGLVPGDGHVVVGHGLNEGIARRRTAPGIALAHLNRQVDQ